MYLGAEKERMKDLKSLKYSKKVWNKSGWEKTRCSSRCHQMNAAVSFLVEYLHTVFISSLKIKR